VVFAVAYPETRGEWHPNEPGFNNLTLATGKSLEQIDEIFGDIQKKHDLEFHAEGDAMGEKGRG
jgi:hypothetical protein